MKYYVHIVKQNYHYPISSGGKRSKNFKLGTLDYNILSFATFEEAFIYWNKQPKKDEYDSVITNGSTKIPVGKSKSYHKYGGSSYPEIYFKHKDTKYLLQWSYIETEVEYGLKEDYATVFITNYKEAYEEARKFSDKFYQKREDLTWNFSKETIL